MTEGAASFPAALVPCACTIHVIEFSLDTACPPAELLDGEERERANRFRWGRDRRRFIAAHAWTRIALARALNKPPTALRFAAGEFGKPYLAAPTTDVRFSLSHSEERGLLALTIGREVGVDIEEDRPIDVLPLAKRLFTPHEIEALSSTTPHERHAAFYRCWTRKEAFTKAVGMGLSVPLDTFAVSLADDDSPQLLHECAGNPEMTRGWRIVHLRTAPGYVGALAAQSGGWQVIRWSFP